MAYITTQDIVRITGIGVEVVNELIGTGDGNQDSFDLKNKNVIASSYTISYSDGEADNNFTSLTETTHYTLDKDSGRIVLTATGLSVTSGKAIWGKYIHSPKVSNTILDSYISRADAEVDKNTGAYWDTPQENTEYFDGRDKYPYPTSDRPYNKEDFDEPSFVQLRNRNVTEILEVSFLTRAGGWANVQTYDDTGSSYTDNTDEANTPGGTAFNVLNATPASNDAIYFGLANKFHGLTVRLFTAGVDGGSLAITWEYYDGSSWTSFTPTAETTGADSFTADGRITWSSLSSWTETTVNGSSSLFFVRARLTAGSYSTAPKANHISPDPDSIISREVPLYSIRWDTFGRVVFLDDELPNGTRNVKVTYNYGKSSVPDLIKELSGLYAGLRAYAYISGGSYDDETGITIGRMQISIGEVYVNVREVVRQFEQRIKDILRVMGKRIHIAVA